MPDFDAVLKEYGVRPRDIRVSLGVSKEAVRLWRRGERKLSALSARLIGERFNIPLWRLRPDIWVPPKPPPPQPARRKVTEPV